MKIEVVTLFPELFQPFLSASLIGKACSAECVDIAITQLRNYSDPPHFRVDDTPYGGGPGMVLSAEPVVRAVRAARKAVQGATVICPSPSGTPFTQRHAIELSKTPGLIFVCPRYEGLDARAIEIEQMLEFSVGDAVVMGGEVPTMMMIEAIVRLIPGVLGNPDSSQHESFAIEEDPLLLEAPQYTKPVMFEGYAVPEELLSGDPKQIESWKQRVAKRAQKRS